MLALICGLTAACAWAVHDLLVRKIGQEAAILPMMLVVLAAGTVALVLPTLLVADWLAMTGPSLGYSAAAGLAYVFGMGGLYRAFSLAPVRLVAPILGAFPMISLGFAAMAGKNVSLIEVAAVLAIVGGIAIVALTGRAEGGHAEVPHTGRGDSVGVLPGRSVLPRPSGWRRRPRVRAMRWPRSRSRGSWPWR